ncbi:MAG: hypothetical protein KGL44_08160 [Sphingomonadales bacterium]|nr:hypothetical protein [Sphingomonadales bacterium]
MGLAGGMMRHAAAPVVRLWRGVTTPDLVPPDPRMAPDAEWIVSSTASGEALIWADAEGLNVRDRFSYGWRTINQIDMVLTEREPSGVWIELRTKITRRKIEVSLRDADLPAQAAVLSLRAYAEAHGTILRPMSPRTRDIVMESAAEPAA